MDQWYGRTAITAVESCWPLCRGCSSYSRCHFHSASVFGYASNSVVYKLNMRPDSAHRRRNRGEDQGAGHPTIILLPTPLMAHIAQQRLSDQRLSQMNLKFVLYSTEFLQVPLTFCSMGLPTNFDIAKIMISNDLGYFSTTENQQKTRRGCQRLHQ